MLSNRQTGLFRYTLEIQSIFIIQNGFTEDIFYLVCILEGIFLTADHWTHRTAVLGMLQKLWSFFCLIPKVGALWCLWCHVRPTSTELKNWPTMNSFIHALVEWKATGVKGVVRGEQPRFGTVQQNYGKYDLNFRFKEKGCLVWLNPVKLNTSKNWEKIEVF